MRANQGRSDARRIGAVVDVDLAAAAPRSPGDVSGMLALKAQFEAWSQSPDIYAVIVRVSGWPSLQANLAQPELAALTRLTWCLDCFPKPLVALIDAPLSGPPLALASVATHRIGTSAYRFSVPPITAPAHLPLGGLAYALARLPGAAGAYLTMTGCEIGPADATALGLLTHSIPDGATAGIIAALADGQPVDPLLDGHEQPAGAATLAAHRETLEHCFSVSDPKAIATRLAAVSGPDAAWAETARLGLARQSAPALAATNRLLVEARHLDLRDFLLLSYKLTVRLNEVVQNFPPLDQLFSAETVDDFSLPSRADIAIGRF
jgi:enoyl-CoA hydratase/carnithine racemase